MDQDDKATAARLSGASEHDSQKSRGSQSSSQSKSESKSDDESRSDAPADKSQDEQGTGKRTRSRKKGKHPNNVRKIRIERMMSKAELARRANLSVLTIDRVEKGFGCRMDTKRKILEALGLSLADRVRVFGEEE